MININMRALPIIGVYKITNLINNKIYIGSSKNCKGRWSGHKCKAAKQYISRAIQKYGVDNFMFEIIEQCLIDELIPREQYWLDYYTPYDRKIGYNISTIAKYPLRNIIISEKTRKYRSDLGKTWIGEKNPFYGKQHSEETKLQLSNSHKGKKCGVENPNYGKTHSEEIRKKISLAGIGRDNKRSKPVKQIDITTGELIKIWDSAAIASKTLNNGKQSHISDVCNGKFLKALGYKWEWVL
jgi:group I intron endonuclease